MQEVAVSVLNRATCSIEIVLWGETWEVARAKLCAYLRTVEITVPEECEDFSVLHEDLHIEIWK